MRNFVAAVRWRHTAPVSSQFIPTIYINFTLCFIHKSCGAGFRPSTVPLYAPYQTSSETWGNYASYRLVQEFGQQYWCWFVHICLSPVKWVFEAVFVCLLLPLDYSSNRLAPKSPEVALLWPQFFDGLVFSQPRLQLVSFGAKSANPTHFEDFFFDGDYIGILFGQIIATSGDRPISPKM